MYALRPIVATAKNSVTLSVSVVLLPIAGLIWFISNSFITLDALFRFSLGYSA